MRDFGYEDLAELELVTLAAALNDPVYAAKLREVNAWEFSTQYARDTQAALLGCLERDGAVSVFSVRQWLVSAGQEQSFAKVLPFFGGVVTTTEFNANLASIRHSASRRSIRRAAAKIYDLAEDQSKNWDEIRSEFVGIMADVAQQSEVSQAEKLGELVDRYAVSERELEEAKLRGEDTTKREGFPWPYHSLDKSVGKSRAGQLIIIAGRPKMGKSVFLGQTMLHWGRYGTGYWWTGEMDWASIVSRVLPADLRKPLSQITLREMHDYARELAPNVWLDTEPMMTAQRLVGRIEAMRVRTEIDYVGVDHLSLLGSDYKQVTAAVQMLRQHAGRWGVPILAGCQINRKATDGNGPVRRPMPSDLRESGRIEEEAAKVLLLHRPYYYDKKEDKRLALVECPLNRFGSPSDNELEWQPELCSLWDRSDYERETTFPTHNAPEFEDLDDEDYDLLR